WSATGPCAPPVASDVCSQPAGRGSVRRSCGRCAREPDKECRTNHADLASHADPGCRRAPFGVAAMHALHLETAGGPVIVLRGDNLAHLRLLATDLLRFKRYDCAKLYSPDERLIECTAC